MNKSDVPYAIDDRFLDQPYLLGGRLIDPIAGLMTWQDKREHLRRKELEVLALLASAGGKQVSRENFVAVVWQGNDFVGDRGLSNTIVFIRRSLHDKDPDHPLIRTIPRRGYQLAVPALPVTPAANPNAVDPAWAPGQVIPGCPGWRLLRPLSASPVDDTWLAEPSEYGEREQGLRVFRFCRSEAHLRHLQREVTLLRYLTESLRDRHDIALIRDWQLDEPPYFLARDYARHGTLHDFILAGGLGSTADTRRRLMAELADAVAAIHALQIVHRQLDARTVLVDQGEVGPQIKISAFELAALGDRARLAPLHITAAGLTQDADAATPARSATEDIRALGGVLLQLALADVGATPDAHGWGQVPDATLRSILERCGGDAADRPTAERLAQQLRALSEGSSQPQTAAASRPQPAHAPSPAVAPATRLPPGTPESIGQYRLLDRLGEGGMGTVYLAEQRDPYRKVALKVIRSGLDGKLVLSRFEAERQAMAMMNHPNVATALDSGLAQDGRPYFAMEYIAGEDLATHCDTHHLGIGARIRLFLQVCDGVLHAHQKGVLHRDIKPSNLLVSQTPDSGGLVKVIDFGLAKSLHGKLAAQTLHTSFGAFVGTPAYCSPEHVSGAAAGVDTRSDIYSMGVVLYELLAGATPIASASLEQLEPERIREIICQSKLPSMRQQVQGASAERQATIAAQRSIRLEELPETLDGDLSWVVGKCLERDPNDRYASVLELKKDLERWLALRPVEARPTSTAYRLRKWIRRNRHSALAASAMILVIAFSTVTAVLGYWQARRALAKEEAASAEARDALDFQVQQIESLDVGAMGTSLRDSLQQSFERQSAASGVAPAEQLRLQSHLTGALHAINFTDLVIQQLDQHYFAPGVRLIGERYTSNPALQEALWTSNATIMQKLGLQKPVLELLEKVHAQRSSRLGPDHPQTLAAQMQWGRMLTTQGVDAKAKAVLSEALARAQQAGYARDEDYIKALHALAALTNRSGDRKTAVAQYRSALAAAEEVLGKTHSSTLGLKLDTGGVLANSGQIEEGARLIEETYQQLVGSEGMASRDTLAALSILSALRNRQGRNEEAIALSQQALEHTRDLYGASNDLTLRLMNNQATYLNAVGRHAEALTQLRELESISAERGLDLDKASNGALRRNIGGTLLALGKLAHAETYLDPQGPASPVNATGVLRLAHLRLAQGRAAEAATLYRELLKLGPRTPGTPDPNLLSATSGLALVLLRQGERSAAGELLQRALAENDASPSGARSPAVLRLQAIHALTLTDPGEDAIEALAEVCAQMQATPGVSTLDRIEALTNLAKLLNDRDRAAEALKHSQAAVELGERTVLRDHYLFAAALIQQGRALNTLAQPATADLVFSQAEQIIRNTEGLDPLFARELSAARSSKR